MKIEVSVNRLVDQHFLIFNWTLNIENEYY